MSVTKVQVNFTPSPIINGRGRKVNGRKLKGASFGPVSFLTLWHSYLQVNMTAEPENCTRNPTVCPWGHFRSWMVSNSYSLITFDKGIPERWKCLRCVQLDDTDRLMCNKTFDASRREDHDADKSELLQVLSETLLKKNYQQTTYILSANNVHFSHFCLRRLNRYS